MFGIDDAIIGGGLSLLGGVAGALGGSGGGGPQRTTQNSSTNWNQTQTNSPWAGVNPYIMGMPFNEDGTRQAGPKGVFPEASRIYGQSGWTPGMQDVATGYSQNAFNRNKIITDPLSGFTNTGAAMAQGQFDPRITAAGPIAGVDPISGYGVDLTTARGSQGVLDPTGAMKDFLTGGSADPWVAKESEAITKSLTRNMMENVMPGIRSGAIDAGQYGSNRQALAEAEAISRLNTDLAPALTALGGDSWQKEQDRRFEAAMDLNRQAGDVATGNANRALTASTTNAANLLDTQKFNTNTVLNNNQQEMLRAGQAVDNRAAGLDFMTGSGTLQDQSYMDMLKGLNLQTDYDFGRLGQYSAAIQPSVVW